MRVIAQEYDGRAGLERGQEDLELAPCQVLGLVDEQHISGQDDWPLGRSEALDHAVEVERDVSGLRVTAHARLERGEGLLRRGTKRVVHDGRARLEAFAPHAAQKGRRLFRRHLDQAGDVGNRVGVIAVVGVVVERAALGPQLGLHAVKDVDEHVLDRTVSDDVDARGALLGRALARVAEADGVDGSDVSKRENRTLAGVEKTNVHVELGHAGIGLIFGCPRRG